MAAKVDLPQRNVAACDVDVSCEPAWLGEASGVAKIIVETNRGSAWCSGVLLNNRREDNTPYFFTAAHCIDTDEEARSIRVQWYYESSFCGSTRTDSRWQTTRGARLLATTRHPRFIGDPRGDATLLKLNTYPPSGTVYQGWSDDDPGAASIAVSIHHPRGGFKQISFGIISLTRSTPGYHTVAWGQGTTSKGSSGSPLFGVDRSLNSYVVGTLGHGEPGDLCEIGQTSRYSKLSSFYPQIAQYLDSSSPPAPVAPPPEPPPVPPATTPKINSFTATPSTINRGGSTTLRWSSSNARRATISGVGSVSTSGSRVVRPTSTTTYRLTITSTNNRSISKNVTVTVRTPGTAPRINSFTATPSTINRGGSATLRWSSSNARRATISGVGSVSTSGSRVVRPTSTTTYRLTITSANNRSTSKNLTVTVRTPGTAPRINSFTATPSTINRGGSATLRWSSSNARRASISGVGSVSTSGSRVVRPTSTTTYRLTITSANNRTTSKNLTVTVRTPGTAPRINSFTATPSTINRGGSTTLRWSSSNANRATISWSGGSSNVSTSGTKVFRPTSTTTYGLKVTSANGQSSTRTITIVVRAPTSAPRINSFTASASSINRGGSVTLRWSSSNASIAFLSNSRDNYESSLSVGLSGSIVVSPTSTTTYRLSVSGEGGRATPRTITISVRGSTPSSSPKINSFTASSLTIARGNSVTLQWSSSNSSSATISGIGSVPTSGSRIVRPTNTTTYRLVVTSSSGHKAEWILTVRVRDPEAEPRINSLTASSTSITRGSSTTLRWSSSNASRARLSWPGDSYSNLSPSGTRTVSPTRTTTYRLTVTSASGQSDTRTITIRIHEPALPKITLFITSYSSIDRGGSTSLRWASSNASRARLSWPGGSLNVSTAGTRTVSPTNTTTYRLTVTSASGQSATDTVTVRVRAPAPKITSFTASPSTIDRGGSTTLRWTSEHATRAIILLPDGSRDVSASGALTVRPNRTTTYHITVSNADGQITTKFFTVIVREPALPIITSFSVSAASIASGENVVLRWTTSNAQTVNLDCGNAPIGGITFTNRRASRASYTLRGITSTAVCFLTATSAHGDRVSSSQVITVIEP